MSLKSPLRTQFGRAVCYNLYIYKRYKYIHKFNSFREVLEIQQAGGIAARVKWKVNTAPAARSICEMCLCGQKSHFRSWNWTHYHTWSVPFKNPFSLCPDLSNALPLQDAWSPSHWAAKKRLCSEFRWTAAAGHCFSQSHSALQGILQAESYVENPALHDSQQTFLPFVNYFLCTSLWASFVPRRHFCRASRWLRQAMTTRNRPCGRSFNRLRCSN